LFPRSRVTAIKLSP